MKTIRLLRARGAASLAAAFMAQAILCGSAYAADNSAAPAPAIPASKTLPVTVGIITPLPIYWAYYGAEALGYFKEQNLAARVVTINEPGCIRGAVGDSIDGCLVGFDGIVRAADAGATVKAIASIGAPTVNALNVDPKVVHTWADLKGQKIAAQTPTEASSIAIKSLLVAHGVSVNDVVFLTIGGSSDRYAALKQGKVAAAITSQPQQFLAAADGFPILGTSLEGGTIASYLAAVPGGTPEHNEALRRLVIAMQKAQQWIIDPANKTQAVQLFESIFKLQHDPAQKSYDLLVDQAKSFSNGVLISTKDLERIKSLIGQYGNTTARSPVANYVDDRYIRSFAKK